MGHFNGSNFKMGKILGNFKIKTDHPIRTRRTDLVSISKKKKKF